MTDSSHADSPHTAPRTEAEIFADLETLCTSPGYVHALAALCWHANFIGYVNALKHKDLEKMHSHDRLLRSEITVLTGLMVKKPIDGQRPSNAVIQNLIDRSESLLAELHTLMQAPMYEHIKALTRGAAAENPLQPSSALREPIFYSGEAAYMFQYRDLALQRYASDKEWFQQNVAFSPDEMHSFICALADFQLERFDEIRAEARAGLIQDPTFLPMFSFTPQNIAERMKCSVETVRSIVDRFSINQLPGNAGFREFGAYNEASARPFIPLGGDSFALLQAYCLAESFYDSPFFWMLEDNAYREVSLKNRGVFTEKFAAARLGSVLGADHVFENVFIVDAKGQRAGEIDVLAVYADRAIVIQAKSKKLTLAARQGNECAIKSDFQKAVQDAYDQGVHCSKLLTNTAYRLAAEDGSTLKIRRDYSEIFIFCLVSENYPALSYQAHQFLRQEKYGVIRPAYVIDIFFLDVLCEMLDTPLHFFNFVHKRLDVFDRVQSESEMAILSYHLVHNLWFDEKYDFVDLGGDFSTHLDAALLVRREGLPGDATPSGILTKLQGTLHHQIATEIGDYEADNVLEFGYYLLAMSEAAATEFSLGCDFILKATAKDGTMHDFTLATGAEGITVHASLGSDAETYEKLRSHCELKKYQQKADKWFGLAIWPGKSSVTRLVLGLDHSWDRSDETEAFLGSIAMPVVSKNVRSAIRQNRAEMRQKIGRNDPCPCGSGQKYKKCCLGKW